MPCYSRRSSKRRIYDQFLIECSAFVISNFRTFSHPFVDRGEEADRTRDSRGGQTTERSDGEGEKMGDQGGIA